MGPKRGVISQSVKDVLQSLVDDDLVLKEKIGSSVSIILKHRLCYSLFLLDFQNYTFKIYFSLN